MSQLLKIALVQMTSVDNTNKNINLIRQIFENISESENVKLVLFPENALYMRLTEGEKVSGIDLNDPIIKELQDIARHRQCHIHIGASPIKIDQRAYNSSLHINPAGHALATYQKMHLFDIDIEGEKAMRESDVFSHGERPSILDIEGWKVGESICYDIRFAELFTYYAQNEVDLILVPAAFLVPTGKVHWEVLLRARAIETQAYVVASAQSGTHRGKSGGERQTYGHSMAIDPWGHVMVQLNHSPQVEIITLNKESIKKVRQQIPMKKHRRMKVILSSDNSDV